MGCLCLSCWWVSGGRHPFLFIFFVIFRKMLHSGLDILTSMPLQKFRCQTVTEDVKHTLLLLLKWQLTLEVNSVSQDLTRRLLMGSAPLGCQILNNHSNFKSLDAPLLLISNLTAGKRCYYSHGSFYQQIWGV